MPAWNSSSLAFSDHNLSRHNSSGLLKNLTERVGKQHLTEHKMFGSKRGMHGKDLKIGKKFRMRGKDTGKKGAISAHMPKSSAISPSIPAFDKMMSSITKGSGNGKKMFSRKSFG
jgi:hypothetical protein